MTKAGTCKFLTGQSRKEFVFRKNPFDKRLKTHKLSGKEKEAWAFWVDYSYYTLTLGAISHGSGVENGICIMYQPKI
ncbi:MAG: hypothetical protein HZA47_07550 [Planctomycetes bacterium]|uniref:hypothetical protein n=1 Tax=Candidatus Wunengus sp. YC65 TaxID=3367701 RepID=UPI001D6A554E|nr:hypothetical protein [Planctomycetota bacterium]